LVSFLIFVLVFVFKTEFLAVLELIL
jgi:hypothetical protein